MTPTPAEAALDRLDTVIREVGEDVQQQGPSWQFDIGEVPVLCVADPHSDRMRFMVPIVEVRHLPEGTLEVLLEANFMSALDARYAISDNIVYAIFLRPLATLGLDEARSGLHQCTELRRTFGTTFSSTDMDYGGNAPSGEH
ncbi:MAG: hypothetical protein AB8H79_24005 [Myxococcota bacterium]